MALFFTVPWIPAAIFGWSPILVVNGIGLSAAVAEWSVVLLWHRRERMIRREVIEALPPASDRWKPMSLMIGGLLTIGIEFWIDTLAPSFLGFGITAFGVSSVLTGWYAWARPILVARTGLVVGASLVPWRRVRSVEQEADMLRIDFDQPHYFYGQKLRVSATVDQIQTVRGLLPPDGSGGD